MIQNVVFDFGNVLARFVPEDFLPYYVQPAAFPQCKKEIFEGPEWAALDRGSMGEGEACRRICARLPRRLHAATAALLATWWTHLQPIAEMRPVVRALSRAGYRLYLLSNASKRLHAYLGQLEAARYMDGIFVSADYQLLKPEPAIYAKFFATFHLAPHTCFFIDDRAENIEAGRAFGMQGHCFDGRVGPLLCALRRAGVTPCFAE